MKPSDLGNQQVKFIFQARTKMLNPKANYNNENKDMSWRAFKKSDCEELNEKIISKNLPK